MALRYQQSICDQSKLAVANEVSRFLLESSLAKAMVRRMLEQKRKLPNRLNDALQDATIMFVMRVLPELRDHKAVWGAFRGTIDILGRRTGASFYDSERFHAVSLDAPLNDMDMDWGDLIGENQERDDETEAEIIDKIVTDQAKMAINEALITSKLKGSNALKWLKRLNKPQEVIALPHPDNNLADSNTEESDKRPESATPPSQASLVVPVAVLARTITSEPMAIEDIPIAQTPDKKPRKANAKIPSTEGYERLVEIRDLCGMAIEPFAKALYIGVPRLRSYLNRKSNVHPEVLARAEQWYEQEGVLRQERLKQLKSTPLADLIEEWKEQTQANSYAALAHIMGISVPTITRWRKPGYKPMHDSHLLEAAEKVERYAALQTKKQAKNPS